MDKPTFIYISPGTSFSAKILMQTPHCVLYVSSLGAKADSIPKGELAEFKDFRLQGDLYPGRKGPASLDTHTGRMKRGDVPAEISEFLHCAAVQRGTKRALGAENHREGNWGGTGHSGGC